MTDLNISTNKKRPIIEEESEMKAFKISSKKKKKRKDKWRVTLIETFCKFHKLSLWKKFVEFNFPQTEKVCGIFS